MRVIPPRPSLVPAVGKPLPKKKRPANVPPTPTAAHRFFDCWVAEISCFVFRVKKPMPTMRITQNSRIYAKEINPQAGDIVICPAAASRIFIGRFIRGDGFRVLMDMPDGERRIIVTQTVLVVHSIEGGGA